MVTAFPPLQTPCDEEKKCSKFYKLESFLAYLEDKHENILCFVPLHDFFQADSLGCNSIVSNLKQSQIYPLRACVSPTNKIKTSKTNNCLAYVRNFSITLFPQNQLSLANIISLVL